MNQKTTVIFDLDGTLLDTLDDLTNSTNYALKKTGYPERTREEIRSFVGNGIAVLIGNCLPKDTAQETKDRIMELFREHYGIHCNDCTRPYDGIPELIDTLKKQGRKMAIVSNKPDFAVKELAEIYFQGTMPIAIGEKESEGIRRKPAPDTVYKAMELLGSTKEESVYIGDSEVDIATAQNAGIDAVLCAWGFRDEDLLRSHGARSIIHKPQELMKLL